MAGKAIMKPSPRSRARVGTAAWTDGVGGASPRAPAPLDTIQSEQSGVAVSTFSSASKCQAMFAPEHTRRWKHCQAVWTRTPGSAGRMWDPKAFRGFQRRRFNISES